MSVPENTSGKSSSPGCAVTSFKSSVARVRSGTDSPVNDTHDATSTADRIRSRYIFSVLTP